MLHHRHRAGGETDPAAWETGRVIKKINRAGALERPLSL